MIRIRFFASLRDMYGDGIDIEFSAGMSIENAWKQVVTTAELDANVLMAVNQEYVQSDYLLNDNDELAFFPPVTGG